MEHWNLHVTLAQSSWCFFGALLNELRPLVNVDGTAVGAVVAVAVAAAAAAAASIAVPVTIHYIGRDIYSICYIHTCNVIYIAC